MAYAKRVNKCGLMFLSTDTRQIRFSNPNSNKHSISSLHSDTWFDILLNRMKTFIHFKCVLCTISSGDTVNTE